MNVDLDVLKGLAEAAGGDLWQADPEVIGATGTFRGHHVWRADGDAIVRCFASMGNLPHPIDDSDVADYVAAASPAVVLELLATIDRLTAENVTLATASRVHLSAISCHEATTAIKEKYIDILLGQSRALHQIGHALGLQAGADVTVDVLVAVREIVAGAKGVVEQLDERGNQAPGHCHTIPGRWDDGNKPEIAGKPCEWCAMWARFKKLAGNAS